MISDEVNDFRRDIRIDGNATFYDLHEAILDSVGYTKDGITTFLLCDDHWKKIGEVALIDDTSNMEDDIDLMKDTVLSDRLTEEKQRLMYTFDMLGDRSFYLELREIIYGEKVDHPEVVRSKGMPPAQESNIEEILAAPTPHRKANEGYKPGSLSEEDEDGDLYSDADEPEMESLEDLDLLEGYSVEGDL